MSKMPSYKRYLMNTLRKDFDRWRSIRFNLRGGKSLQEK
jgi:predicted GTPase